MHNRILKAGSSIPELWRNWVPFRFLFINISCRCNRSNLLVYWDWKRITWNMEILSKKVFFLCMKIVGWSFSAILEGFLHFSSFHVILRQVIFANTKKKIKFRPTSISCILYTLFVYHFTFKILVSKHFEVMIFFIFF